MASPSAPVVVYVRVSTDQQAREGVSLEAQEARARAWAASQGRAVGAVFIDAGISGSRADNRPELAAALDAVTASRSVLVVYSLSRLARSTSDTLAIADRLDRAGADLVSLSESIDTTTAAGRMVFRMLAVLSEFERDLVAERTAAAMAAKRARSEFTGGSAPFGYRVAADGVHIVEDELEQAATLDILALRASGLSYRKIASELRLRGIAPRNGCAWSPKVLRSIVQRNAA